MSSPFQLLSNSLNLLPRIRRLPSTKEEISPKTTSSNNCSIVIVTRKQQSNWHVINWKKILGWHPISIVMGYKLIVLQGVRFLSMLFCLIFLASLLTKVELSPLKVTLFIGDKPCWLVFTFVDTHEVMMCYIGLSFWSRLNKAHCSIVPRQPSVPSNLLET